MPFKQIYIFIFFYLTGYLNENQVGENPETSKITLQTFLFHLKNKLRLSRQHQALEVAESEEDEEEDDEDYLTRDDFNLHKMVVLATSAGKVCIDNAKLEFS